jgi:hypothetical protein
MQPEQLKQENATLDDTLKAHWFSMRTLKIFSWMTFSYIYFYGVVTLLAVTSWYQFFFPMKYFL